ncbi:MAG TPA: hypothetical protein VI039_06470 [Solirubrobacterales bacterium]
MAFTVIALMAPATAPATATWTTGSARIGGPESPTTVGLHGELRSTINGFSTGPAKVDGHGNLWNGIAMGEGEITSFTFTGELPATPGLPESCKATGTAAVDPPWKLTLTTDILDDLTAHFTYHYNAVCQALGFPAMATIKGVATAEMAGNCLQFSNSGDLTTGFNVPVTLNGQICLTDLDEEGEPTEEVMGIEE